MRPRDGRKGQGMVGRVGTRSSSSTGHTLHVYGMCMACAHRCVACALHVHAPATRCGRSARGSSACPAPAACKCTHAIHMRTHMPYTCHTHAIHRFICVSSTCGMQVHTHGPVGGARARAWWICSRCVLCVTRTSLRHHAHATRMPCACRTRAPYARHARAMHAPCTRHARAGAPRCGTRARSPSLACNQDVIT